MQQGQQKISGEVQNNNNTLEGTIRGILANSADGTVKKDIIDQAMTLHRGFNPVTIIKTLDDLEKRGDAYCFDGLYYTTS